MKSILFFGNCQIQKLSYIFKYMLESSTDIVTLTQVQEINDNAYFKLCRAQVEAADYLVIQNFNGSAKDPFVQLIPYVKASATVVVIDSLYCSFFHPELFSSQKINSFRIGMLHDINVLHAFVKGVSLSDFLKNDPFQRENFYSKKVFDYAREVAFSNLLDRQQSTYKKIELSKFKNENLSIKHVFINELLIKHSRFKRELWGDFNHPHNEVYRYLVKRLFKEFGLYFDSSRFDNEFNENKNDITIKYPIYKSTINDYGFDEHKTSRVYNLGSTYTNKSRIEYVTDTFEHYQAQDIKQLSNLLVDNLREKAIFVEKTDLALAIQYMQTAHQFRPNASFIKVKLDSYVANQKIDENN